jgi:hypothetical protein
MPARAAHGPTGPGRSGLVRYIAMWALGGALVAGLILVVAHERAARRAAAPALPPVREATLGEAAVKAGCRLSRVPDGPRQPAGAARGGISRRPLTADGRAAATEHGLVVVEYRSDVDDGLLDRLVAVQRSVPHGTLLAPAAAPGDVQLSATSYDRQLRCPRVTPVALDALQLFRGRYLGRTPRR